MRVFRHYPAPPSPGAHHPDARPPSMHIRRSPLILSGLLAIGLALSGCVAGRAPAPGDEGFNDPYEDTNRGVFAFNQAVDRNVLVPVAEAYRTVLPPPVQQS